MAGGLPPFPFSTRSIMNLLACPVREYIRATDAGGNDPMAPMLAWSAGPVAIGETGQNRLEDIIGAVWLLQVCPDGDWLLYRVERGGLAQVPWDDPPDPAGATARHVGLAFDQSARVAITWEDAGTIYVRRWDPVNHAYVQDISSAGHDPVIALDATWSLDIPQSDVIVFYLSSDREKVMARVQRDVYATPYQLWDFGAGTVLDRAIALPIRYELLVSDANGDPLADMLISDPYPYLAYDGMSGNAAGPASGDYVLRVLTSELVEALGVGATGPVSGAYVEPVINYEPDAEGIDVDAAGPASGDYTLIVITHEPDAEGIDVAAVGPAGGTYA